MRPRGHALPDRWRSRPHRDAGEICGGILEGRPSLADGGQDDVAVAIEICGCVLEGMPILADGGQDYEAVVVEICGCVLEGTPNLTDGGQDNLTVCR